MVEHTRTLVAGDSPAVTNCRQRLNVFFVFGNSCTCNLVHLIVANAVLMCRDGWTPLLKAIAKGNEPIVRLLLAAGADANAGHQ